MEVFSCFTCPHCKTFHDEMLPKLMRDFVNPGKVYLVNRDFPLNHPDHRHCREAHAWANAAARIGKYQAVTAKLWASQSAWSASGKIWETIAPALSPEEQKKVQALVKDPSVTSEIDREPAGGVAAGVGSTPTLIITKAGRRIPVPSVENYTLLKSLLDSLLK
jgi:protein-disulfide isomerase